MKWFCKSRDNGIDVVALLVARSSIWSCFKRIVSQYFGEEKLEIFHNLILHIEIINRKNIQSFQLNIK